MTEKQFTIVSEEFILYFSGTAHKISNGECTFRLWHNKEESQKICDKLNELNEENERLKASKEYWKAECLSNGSLNQILRNELDIAQEKGYAPTEVYKRVYKKY